MGIKKDFLGGHKVYHSTERIISSKKVNGDIVIKTAQHDKFVLKSDKAKKQPEPGSFITIYYICSSQVVGVDINGSNLYFLDEKDI
jgi:hypothetical protein